MHIVHVYLLICIFVQAKPVWCSDWWQYTTLWLFSVISIKSSRKYLRNHDTVSLCFVTVASRHESESLSSIPVLLLGSFHHGYRHTVYFKYTTQA